LRQVKLIEEVQKDLSLEWLPAMRSGLGRVEERGLDPDQSNPPTIGTVSLFWRWSMQLGSSAFSSGSAIPRRFTCDGEDRSPPLDWRAVPPATRSLVLLCDDPDAPAGKWHHWAAYDIEARQTGLAEGAGRDSGAAQFKQAINDFHRAGYGGPCPPRGHGPHRYHFRLLALSVDHLSLDAKPSCSEVEREARRHVIAETTLVGIYQR
jgi:hypothetical protein